MAQAKTVSNAADGGPSRLLGELAFATLLLVFVAWYFLDAWTTSTSAENLILILPVSALCLLLYGVIVVQLLRRRPDPGFPAAAQDTPAAEGGAPTAEAAAEEAAAEAGAARRRDRRAFALMGLTCLYVAALVYLPFDLITVVYLAAAMVLNGERRWAFVGLYSLAFGLFVVVGFQTMLSIPFPTLLPLEP